MLQFKQNKKPKVIIENKKVKNSILFHSPSNIKKVTIYIPKEENNEKQKNICEYCNTKNDKDAKYCKKCGNSLKQNGKYTHLL